MVQSVTLCKNNPAYRVHAVFFLICFQVEDSNAGVTVKGYLFGLVDVGRFVQYIDLCIM